MIERGCDHNINSLIDTLYKADRVDEAWAMFCRMRKMRKMLYPDNITLCTLLLGVAKDGRIEDAFKIAKSFVQQVRNQRDNSFWRDLIEGILCDVEIVQSISLVERLIVYGLCRNDSVLIPLIKVMCKHKKALDAHKLFVKFTSSFGIQPTLEAYYVMIVGFLDVHLTEMAWGLFKEMKTVGFAPDVFTYNLLLNDLGKSRRVDEIFAQQGIGDFNPTPCTYGPLIDGLLKLGNLDEAKSFFNEMVDYGCKPNCAIYNILINGFGKGGDVETTCELFNRMVKKGIRPDLKSYTILVDCLWLVGKVDDAVHYFEELKSTGIDPDLISYNLMINGLGRSRRIEEALSLFNEMQSRGIIPNLYTYNSLILNLGIAGMIEEAGKMYEEHLLKGLEPNVFTYNALIRGYESMRR
ncbi:hypothetical protein TEA_012151 [Camellia sinensis var. sinensis]|uniref:Pentacotripeptide-repeat region of PRORP domain-containing protein n=1 Tax=Camellia sinensis var. sinensis TaxID=542762 RepID=A0A4S4DPH0_CAMSN|nr:hypothetical protein TEA_012151 [Camellia sinensis var. sinensis]